MSTIRSYHDDDFSEVLELLNDSCDFDTFSEDLLKEKLYEDPFWNPDYALLYFEDSILLGFMYGVEREIRETKYSFIKLMAVKEGSRRKGIGSMLLSELESIFSHKGIGILRIYDVPLNYYMPGIDPRYTEAVCFALKSGFKKKGEALNMTVDLDSRSWATDAEVLNLQQEGILISRAEDSDLGAILEFIKKEWALWEFEIRMAFSNSPPSIFIAKKDGLVKAFSAYDGNNKGTGWFGPMGTDTVFRGKGIGKILLYHCLSDMKMKGFKSSIIPWVDPIAFYSHYADAKITRTFWRYEKELKII